METIKTPYGTDKEEMNLLIYDIANLRQNIKNILGTIVGSASDIFPRLQEIEDETNKRVIVHNINQIKKALNMYDTACAKSKELKLIKFKAEQFTNSVDA